jgi:hypothetical protein
LFVAISAEPADVTLGTSPYLFGSGRQIPGWASMRRKALALTQTCRQLRSEVLPIHRDVTRVAVSLSAVANYVASFSQNPSKATGNLVVAVPRDEEVFDVLKIARLVHSAPSLNISLLFENRICNEAATTLTSQLLDFRNNPR